MKHRHRFLLATLLPVLFTAASAQTAAKVERFTLANGMTVIVKPDRRAPTAAHML
ncbi:MAG: insulinase family protein, partial [Polaromonas sp.]|nr:insulinase family protein [Polaromonas sp.]